MTTPDKPSPYHFTDAEREAITAFAARKGVEVEFRRMHDSDRAYLTAVDGERRDDVAKIAPEKTGGRHFSKRQRWLVASGPRIPLQANRRYGDGERRRQNIAALLEDIDPFTRGKSAADLAREASKKAVTRLEVALERERSGLDLFPYLNREVAAKHLASYVLLHKRGRLLYDMTDDECAEVMKIVKTIERAEFEQAVTSAMREMWSHFDERLPGGHRYRAPDPDAAAALAFAQAEGQRRADDARWDLG